MRLPWLRRRKQPDDAASIPLIEAQDLPPPPTSTVDLTLSRRVFYRPLELALGASCPCCGKALSPETGVCFIATRKGGRRGDNFMISGDFGFYCPACPTVVIALEKLVDISAPAGVNLTRTDQLSTVRLEPVNKMILVMVSRKG